LPKYIVTKISGGTKFKNNTFIFLMLFVLHSSANFLRDFINNYRSGNLSLPIISYHHLKVNNSVTIKLKSLIVKNIYT